MSLAETRNREAFDLPMDFEDAHHEALVSVWWTGALLRRAWRGLFRGKVGSETEFNLLMSLKYAKEPLTQKELGRRLLVDKANVTGLIDRLEVAGLVRRNAVPGDRRRYHITLTAAGGRLIDKLDAVYEEKVARIMAGLTAEENAVLIRLTRKMREGLAQSESRGAKP